MSTNHPASCPYPLPPLAPETLADALWYIEHEYTLADGGIDGEMIAEGLAFSRKGSGDRENLAAVPVILAAFDERQWYLIVARAAYLRREQGL